MFFWTAVEEYVYPFSVVYQLSHDCNKPHGLITVWVEFLRQFHTSGQVLVDDVSEKEYCA